MSFILDALRKSENERQRSAVPRVTRAPLARPRTQPPVWTMVIIAALTGCVIVLAVAWWMTTSGAGAATIPVESRQTAQSPATGAAAAAPSPGATSSATATPQSPPASAASSSAASAPAGSAGSTPAAPPRTAPLDSLAVTPVPAPAATPPATAAPGVSSSPAQQIAGAGGFAASGTSSGDRAPTVAELAADGINTPDLRLELHAYDANAARRFVFINGQRYAEGDTLREGPRVTRIDPDSVTFDYGGTRFRLNAQ